MEPEDPKLLLELIIDDEGNFEVAHLELEVDQAKPVGAPISLSVFYEKEEESQLEDMFHEFMSNIYLEADDKANAFVRGNVVANNHGGYEYAVQYYKIPEDTMQQIFSEILERDRM